MRLACSLINGDGFDFEYATVDITSEYAAWLFQLASEAARLKQTHETFYAIECFDYTVQYGSASGLVEGDTGELIDSDGQWIEIPDNHRWPEGCLQSVSAPTVVVTADTIYWRAAAKYDDTGMYFETPPLTVAQLRKMFPAQLAEPSEECEARRYILYDHDTEDLATTTVYTSYEEAADDASQLDNVIVLALALETDKPVCECEQPGYFCSGVPGILARVENGRLVEGAKVERCDLCQRYPSDKAAFEKLVELGIASRETVD